MNTTESSLPARKRIALVAHDSKKAELLAWVGQHKETLSRHILLGTGTTGGLVAKELGIPVERLQSGPLGGDLQIGARITEGTVDLLIFFWDPLAAQPHDPDVKALLRVAVLWNIPIASNTATADFLFASTHLEGDYTRTVPVFPRPSFLT